QSRKRVPTSRDDHNHSVQTPQVAEVCQHPPACPVMRRKRKAQLLRDFAFGADAFPRDDQKEMKWKSGTGVRPVNRAQDAGATRRTMKLIDLSDYNRPAKTYWTVMVIAGASVFVW